MNDSTHDPLHERFHQFTLPVVDDAADVAELAIRRGLSRRRRARGMRAGAAGAVLSLAVVMPALAAQDDGADPVHTAGEGVVDEHDDGYTPKPTVDDDEPTSPTDEPDAPDGTTTTKPEQPDGTTKPYEPEPDPEPKPYPEPDPVTTTTKPDEPDPTTTTTKPEGLEQLELWCGRGDGEEAGGVVCEWSVSEHDDFAAYRLYRSGPEGTELIWTYGQRTMPDRPWPDIRFFDAGGTNECDWTYKVIVVNGEGTKIGVSNTFRVAAPDGPTTTTTAPPDGGDF